MMFLYPSTTPYSRDCAINRYCAKFFLLLRISIIVCAAHAVHAEDIDSLALSPEQLFNATVMSVSKTAEKVMDAPAAVYVLTNEDIMRSGATSIPEALRLVPGVQVAQVNSNGWAISVRGFNSDLSNKLLVLIDGREVYDPLFSGVYWDVQDTVLEDIDRIEVVRGPGGTLWGDNAVNGVINIITKKATETQGNLASIVAGNHEKAIGEERYGGTFDDGGAWRAYGKFTDRGDNHALHGGNSHDSWQQGRGGFRADWDKIGTHDDSFTLQGDTYSSASGQMRFEPILTNGTNPLVKEYIDARGTNLLGRWKREFSDDSNLTVQSYVDYVYRDQLLIKDARTSADFDAQYEAPRVGAHKFTVGARYRYSEDELTATPDSTFLENRAHDQIANTFVQDKITLDPKTWFLTLGSKFEENSYSGFEIQPSARLQWHPDEQQMVWAAVSRAVRTPSRLEQDVRLVQATGFIGGLGVVTVDTVPNPNLYSEELVAYELGYRRELTPTASLDVAAFYNDYYKLATYTVSSQRPFGSILALAPTNSTTGETHGVEAMLDWRALDNLRLSASGSLLTMKLNGPTAVPNQTENQSPTFQGNLRAEWDITKDVAFDTMLYRVNALPAFQVPSYTRLDMRLGWRFAPDWQFDLVGQNLFNPEHPEFTSPTDGHVLATDIGTSIYGKLTCRF